jgi:hypothetical protein
MDGRVSFGRSMIAPLPEAQFDGAAARQSAQAVHARPQRKAQLRRLSIGEAAVRVVPQKPLLWTEHAVRMMKGA